MVEINPKKIHTGHRQRLKQKVRDFGIERLAQHEIIEYLLFFGIPVKDTNKLAHELIANYGSVAGVLNAKYEELLAFKNMTADAAQLLSSMSGVVRSYLTSGRCKGEVILNTPIKSRQYFNNIFANKSHETFVAVYLDSKFKIINETCIDSNTQNRINVSPRNVLENAINFKAVSVIIAHNHPAGDCTPSTADINFTKVVESTLENVGVNFIDHMILSNTDFFSFKEAGL